MKRFTYLLTLGALLVLGTGCDKESSTPVPLYVNTWTNTIGDAASDKGLYTQILGINADKTFYIGLLATEDLIKELKEEFLPSTDDNTPAIDGDTPQTDGDASEMTDEEKEIIEKINSIQVNDIITMMNGMYVETQREKEGCYLSLFILQEISGMEMAEFWGSEIHLLEVTRNTITIKSEPSSGESTDSDKPMTLTSLAASGLTVGKIVDGSDFMIK